MLLSLRSVSKSYAAGAERTQILHDVSFDLGAGETLALTGESGSGKSTLLHLIAGLDAPDTGQIILTGSPVHDLDDAGRARLRRGTIGLVFQQFNLVPSLTVAANIAFQARLAGQYDPDWAAELAGRLGLTDHLPKYPEALSGGQQQRVAIARTLAPRPKLVLADEPTGNLDEDTADRVFGLLLDCAATTGAAVLVVTHSQHLAQRLGRRLHLTRGRLAP